MKFIKLNKIRSDGNSTIVVLNVEAIQCFQMGTKGRDTHIRMIDKSFFFVKESLDSIWLMLITDYSKAPVIMTAAEALVYYKLKDTS